MNAQAQLKRGDIVRSTVNKYAPLFRVINIGPKRAKLYSAEGGFMSCYCRPSILRLVIQK